MCRLEDDEGLVLTPFEKNLEVWRQLWRVLERSDIVVQVCYSTSVTLQGDTTTHTSRIDVIEHNVGLVSADFDLFSCLWLGMSYAGQLLCNATLTMLHTVLEKQHAGLLAPSVMQGVHSAVALMTRLEECRSQGCCDYSAPLLPVCKQWLVLHKGLGMEASLLVAGA